MQEIMQSSCIMLLLQFILNSVYTLWSEAKFKQWEWDILTYFCPSLSWRRSRKVLCSPNEAFIDSLKEDGLTGAIYEYILVEYFESPSDKLLMGEKHLLSIRNSSHQYNDLFSVFLNSIFPKQNRLSREKTDSSFYHSVIFFLNLWVPSLRPYHVPLHFFLFFS